MAHHAQGGPTRPSTSGDGAGAEGSLLRLEAILSDHSPAFVILAGLLFVVVVGVVDVATGPVFSLAFFYLLPVGLVTFARGRIPGLAIALTAAIAWSFAEVATGRTSATSPVTYWNVGLRWITLGMFALLTAAVGEALAGQRDVAAQEAEANAKLRALNELKDTLLHAVSHDLKGPIAAIRGSVNTLSRARLLQLSLEQSDGLVEAISISAKRLDRLVSDLLDLERLDRGVVEPERVPTNVEQLVRSCVQDNDIPSDHPVVVSADPLLVDADRAMVERIVDNLLLNAVKHTPPGTPIAVSVRAADDGILLSVEDEGPGIPDELKHEVFEPFRQGERASAAGSGVGIGLSLVAKFAELHGGRAWIEDRPGGGTVFRVCIPGAVSSAVPTAVPPAREPIADVG